MVLALSGRRCNCRTWVPRARDPGPGRADPKRRHDGRPSRPTADGRPGMGSVRGPILSLEAMPAEAVHGSRAHIPGSESGAR